MHQHPPHVPSPRLGSLAAAEDDEALPELEVPYIHPLLLASKRAVDVGVHTASLAVDANSDHYPAPSHHPLPLLLHALSLLLLRSLLPSSPHRPVCALQLPSLLEVEASAVEAAGVSDVRGGEAQYRCELALGRERHEFDLERDRELGGRDPQGLRGVRDREGGDVQRELAPCLAYEHGLLSHWVRPFFHLLVLVCAHTACTRVPPTLPRNVAVLLDRPVALAERTARVVVHSERHVMPALALERTQLLPHLGDKDRDELALAALEGAERVGVGVEGKLNEPAARVHSAVLDQLGVIFPDHKHLRVAPACAFGRCRELLAVRFEVQLQLLRRTPRVLLFLALHFSPPPPDHDFSELISAVRFDLGRRFF
mmetsp:Transcript_20050/g.30823  ORF Transcript_20050/g.30823 Transcript_20050/m.30823 type:complete len:369 (-) Transcript_20050:825-1931(-)